MPTRWPHFQDLCPPLGDSLYFNIGTCVPLLEPIHEAITQANRSLQSPSPKPWLVTESVCMEARQKLASLLGAHPSEISLTENGTFSMNAIIAGIPWQAGDGIIITAHEHVSSLVPCFNIAKRYDLSVTLVDPDDKTDEEMIGALAKAIDQRTRLIVASHVTWNTGRILPVADICRLARDHGVLTLIDGAQGAGNVDVDVKAIGCDAYALSGHKWLLGPTGTGACYITTKLVEQLWPLAAGYQSITGFSLDGQIDWKMDSQKMEGSTKNIALIAGFTRGLELLEQYQLPAVTSQIHHLATWFKQQLLLLPDVTLFNDLSFPASGLVCFRIEGLAHEEIVDYCLKHHLYIRHLPRPEGIRFSIHAFHSHTELIRALVILEAAIHHARKQGGQHSTSVLVASHRE
jgi:selenocysteine lyase/cysteine desulfurase